MVDVRQRRGVRGSEYSWANSMRLQAMLAEAGIGYRHHKELAPTTELRQSSTPRTTAAGSASAPGSSSRPSTRVATSAEILDAADLDGFARSLPGDTVAALLCVERDPEACHRSLIAERLAADHGARIVHLRPQGG